MGFLEEGRQLIQDFVTPEIRSIDAWLTALEKKMGAFEESVDKRFDKLEGKIDRVDGKIDRLQASLEAKMERNQQHIMDTLHRMENYSQILERLARLEGKQQNVA